MWCDICGLDGAVGMAEKREDYVAYLAESKVTKICAQCDGREHWLYARKIREEEAQGQEDAGAVASRPSSSHGSPQSVRGA